MRTGTELRLGWFRVMRAWRDWAETWPIAEVFMPPVSMRLAHRLIAVLLTGMLFSAAHYLQWLLQAGVDVAALGERVAFDGVILLLATVGGIWSSRQQLALHPRSLLLAAVDIVLVVAALVLVLGWVGTPPAVSARWVIAIAACLAATAGVSLRLWAMLSFSVQGIRMLRAGHDAARATTREDAHETATLLVRLDAIDDGDPRVVMRCGDEDREVVLARELLPSALRGTVATGAWLLIEDAVVEWGDTPRIVAGRVIYVGPDPDRPRQSWICGETIVGASAIVAYHALAIVLAYGLTLYPAS